MGLYKKEHLRHRMFLRFLIAQGKYPASLYASVPSFAHWQLSALPRYLQPDQVEKIIASADPKTPIGSRNRATLKEIMAQNSRVVEQHLAKTGTTPTCVSCGIGSEILPDAEEAFRKITKAALPSRQHMLRCYTMRALLFFGRELNRS
jgi:hypothetical protein